ncbi:hypothetical protein DPMN_074743 [Dreissena polymorpha]|uniref:Uncharacterized protein n=1 Tax=Dreissena polymorpha TaxID=45954 RepID=A0A9D4BEB1_DREPO|nr:hypothetical protein DPMN_074743 [Dreissena polymorpha]
MNYSQQHTPDLTVGGFLYRRPSFPSICHTGQGIDFDEEKADEEEEEAEEEDE